MILCCGEALVEMQALPAEDGAPRFAAHPGGTALGTAVALGRLGTPAGFLGGISTDRFGALLAQSMTAAQVDLSLAPRSPHPTTLAFTALDGTAELRDGNTAGRMLEATRLPPLPPRVTALAFGGVHLSAEPCGSAFETLARDAGPRAVLLDPNIRPDLIADPAGFRARLQRMIARADILKLSEADLAWLGSPSPQSLRAAGPALVVITHGARGATGHGPEGALFVPAPSVTVADRLGAGEAFAAGLLTALHRAELLTPAALASLPAPALRSALTLGVHAAAVTVSRRGANPPHAQDLG